MFDLMMSAVDYELMNCVLIHSQLIFGYYGTI